MGIFRRSNNPNALVGLFLLIILAIFAGPNALPRLLSSFVPFVDEGVPCSRLRQAEDRGNHQSWIGRAASQQEPPVSLRLDDAFLPSEGNAVLRIVVINETIGTVPLVDPGAVIINNPNLNGVGIVFGTTPIPPATQQGGLVPDSNIRLLGPRQRCVVRVEIPAGNVNGQTIRAFYRNTVNSPVTGIFTDQGLWVGVVESAPETFIINATAQ